MAAPAARERANSDGRGGRGPAGSAAGVGAVANEEGGFPAPRHCRVPFASLGGASRPRALPSSDMAFGAAERGVLLGRVGRRSEPGLGHGQVWPECGVGNGSGFSDVNKKLFWSSAAARWARGRARETGGRGPCCSLLQQPQLSPSSPPASEPTSLLSSRSPPAAASQPADWPVKQPVLSRTSQPASCPTPQYPTLPSAPLAASQPASPLPQHPCRSRSSHPARWPTLAAAGSSADHFFQQPAGCGFPVRKNARAFSAPFSAAWRCHALC